MKTYLFFILLPSLLIFEACAPTYNPTPAQPALFSSKGQGNIGTSWSGSAGNVHGGLSLSDHVALTSTFNAFYNSYTLNNTFISRGYNWDILTGYYQTFGENGVIELLGGYGIGAVNAPDYVGNLHKLYLQPSIGWKADQTEGALTFRLTELFLPAPNPGVNKNGFFIEPVGTFRFGGPGFKGFTQMGFSLSPQSLLRGGVPTYNPFFINLGVMLSLRKD